MAMFRVCLVYIIIAVVCGVVGALRSSRGGRRREAVGVRRGGFPTARLYVGWGPGSFWWYVFIFNRHVFV